MYDTYSTRNEAPTSNGSSLLGFAFGFVAAFAIGTYALSQAPATSMTYTAVPARVAPAMLRPNLALQASRDQAPAFGRRGALVAGVGSAATVFTGTPQTALARTNGVSKPELIPAGDKVDIIDLVGVLSPQDVAQINDNFAKIEKIYGVHMHLLIANFPETPGEAIFKYWGSSDPGELGGKQDLNILTMFVDYNDPTGNSIRFDSGDNLNFLAPNGRWFTSLKAKYGTKKARNSMGDAGAIVQCVEAVLDGLTLPDELGMGIY